jgi:predicted HTH domain antitoxin
MKRQNSHLTLDISAEVLEGLRLPPGEIEGELRKELALALYQRQAIGLGKARLLAQMSRWEFEDLLGKRAILRHYTAEELQEDIQYGLGGQ